MFSFILLIFYTKGTIFLVSLGCFPTRQTILALVNVATCSLKSNLVQRCHIPPIFFSFNFNPGPPGSAVVESSLLLGVELSVGLLFNFSLPEEGTSGQ